MKHTLTVACIILKSAGQTVCRPFSDQFRRLSTLRSALTALLLAPLAALHAADVPKSPMQVWADYDPNKGDFKEEIISEETKDGITNSEFYISAYVLGEDVQVYCKYSVKAPTPTPATPHPGPLPSSDEGRGRSGASWSSWAALHAA